MNKKNTIVSLLLYGIGFHWNRCKALLKSVGALKFLWGHFLYNLLVAYLVAMVLGVSPFFLWGASLLSGMLLGCMRSGRGFLSMALQKEIWQRHIEDDLVADLPFLPYAVNVSDYVLDGKVVHMPQSGASGITIVKNRATFPAQVKRRTDTELTYELASYTTDPMHLTNAEQAELSYNKRESMLLQVRNELSEYAATNLLHEWVKDLPVSHILRTEGESVSASAPSSTGNRKSFSERDLQRAMTALAKQRNTLNGTLVALVPYTLLSQLMSVGTTNAIAQTWLTEQERRSGIVARLQNFIILPTPTRLVADAAGAIKAYGATAATTDNEVILCWEKNAFEYALGQVTMFENKQDPQYYGDVYSFLLRFSGRRRRKDNAGVVAIVPEVTT